MRPFNKPVMVLAMALVACRVSAQEIWEGRYQIGHHRCTVTPIRMAFELTCPKDSAASGIYVYSPRLNHKGDVVGPPRYERSTPQPAAKVLFQQADLKVGQWSTGPAGAKGQELLVLKLSR